MNALLQNKLVWAAVGVALWMYWRKPCDCKK